MKGVKQTWLVFKALYELARYEVINRLHGSGCILRQLRGQAIAKRLISCELSSHELERAICGAVLFATCLYWKPVLCLQQSVCTIRLLRRHGIVARLVIGYRPSPFFSHAWVEVDGRVVYGSSAYQKRLTLLYVA